MASAIRFYIAITLPRLPRPRLRDLCDAIPPIWPLHCADFHFRFQIFVALHRRDSGDRRDNSVVILLLSCSFLSLSFFFFFDFSLFSEVRWGQWRVSCAVFLCAVAVFVVVFLLGPSLPLRFLLFLA